MNFPQRCLILPLLELGLEQPAQAQVVTRTVTVNQTVPDGSLSGIASSVNISSTVLGLSDLSVSLSLSPGLGGGFSGDLYATLVHGNDSIVLLNRPGRDSGRRSGYGDGTNIDVIFSAAGVNDIHIYREVLNGSPAIPLGNPLTGGWQPDGRSVSPLSVVNASARNPTMDAFNFTTPDGLWTLFVADVSSGGIYQLNEWTIEFSELAVPEPSETVAVFAIAACVAGLWLRRSDR